MQTCTQTDLNAHTHTHTHTHTHAHTRTHTVYWAVRVVLTCAARLMKLQSSIILSRVAHVTGRTPFPCSQCWNTDRQHNSTPFWPSSAWIRCRVAPDASKSSRSPMSLHCAATVLMISIFCPSGVRITLNSANRGAESSTVIPFPPSLALPVEPDRICHSDELTTVVDHN